MAIGGTDITVEVWGVGEAADGSTVLANAPAKFRPATAIAAKSIAAIIGFILIISSL